MRRKRIVAFSICICLVFTSISTAVLGISSGGDISKIPLFEEIKGNNVLLQDFKGEIPKNVIINSGPKSILGITDIKDEEWILKSSGDGDILYEGTREYAVNGESLKNDKYELSQEDIEGLINDGHSISDILKADNIGNRIDADPRDLLRAKKENGKDLSVIENDILLERKQSYLHHLKDKYPEESKLLQERKISEDDQLKLLTLIDIYKVESFTDLIEEYKELGSEALTQRLKSHETSVSKDLMDKYELVGSSVQGLTDKALEKLAAISEKTGKPVNEIIQSLKKPLQNGGQQNE